MGLYKDIKDIFRKDFKLFIAINAIYFGMIIVGAAIALAYPAAQLALIQGAGQSFGSEGPYGSVGDAYATGNVPAAAVLTFITNFFVGTLGMLTIPSLIIPFWALLFGAFRALLWGVMLVVPVPGVLPLSTLAPHYLTLLLEGEGYIVAMFACTRGLMALLKPSSFGKDSRLKAYWQSIKDNGKLLLVVAVILAVAAAYEAWEVPFFSGTATPADQFYAQEFGPASSYSNWTQDVRANSTAGLSFNIGAGKPARAQVVTNGTPVDVLIMDDGNFSVFNATPAGGWSAYVVKSNVTNVTFDFTAPQGDTYWFVTRNAGQNDSAIHAQFRYKQ
jgi:hypothetical protein